MPLGPGVIDPKLLDDADLDRLRTGVRIMALRTFGNSDSADEVVQETLTRALAAVHAGQPSDPLKLAAYVAGIARNVIARMLRDGKRTLRLDPSVEESVAQPGPNALEEIVDADERAQVRAALAELSAVDRMVLRLAFVEDLDSVEIAARLGEPADRVRKRKSRALERLRTIFLAGKPGHKPGPIGTEPLKDSG